ncbi:MAG: CehA/McbA family metallohydrolase [Armatimonadota bacterium]
MNALSTYSYKGCLHVHSTYSDGGGSIEEIMQAAQAAGLDFVLVTDHNTLGALKDGKEGWYGRSLALVGAEITLAAGHFLAFDIPPDFTWKKEPVQDVIDMVNACGGFGFYAHPTSRRCWTDWEASGYAGIEILNLSSLFTEAGKRRPARLLFDFACGCFKDTFRAMQTVISGAKPCTEKWEKLLGKGRCVSIAGADAHALLKVGRVRLGIPSYADVFKTLGTYIITCEPLNGELVHDKILVYDALRAGRSYTAFSLWGDAGGFEFFALSPGETRLMGESIKTGGKPVFLNIKIPGERRVLVKVFRSSKLIMQTNRHELSIPNIGRGIYRVEVSLLKSGRHVPWIISNPIFVEE